MEKHLLIKQNLIESVHDCFLVSSNSPKIIHSILKKYLQGGYPKQKMIDDLREYKLFLREKNNEKEEDFILDCIDMLTGYISPQWKL